MAPGGAFLVGATSGATCVHMISAEFNMKRIGPGDSVRIGSIWVPVKLLPQALASFTNLVFCLTGSDDHPYSLRGSATGLKFQDQHLLFCCRHQIADRSPGEVVVPVDKRGSGTKFIGLNDLPEFSGQGWWTCARCTSIRPITASPN
jgi:hypothetical protein